MDENKNCELNDESMDNVSGGSYSFWDYKKEFYDGCFVNIKCDSAHCKGHDRPLALHWKGDKNEFYLSCGHCGKVPQEWYGWYGDPSIRGLYRVQ